MPYNITWFKPDQILLSVVTGELTLEELQRSSQEMIRYLDQAEHPLYLVGDLTGMTAYPTIALDTVRAAGFVQHPRMGGVVVFGIESRLLLVIINILISFSPARFKIAKSLDESLALIEEWINQG